MRATPFVLALTLTACGVGDTTAGQEPPSATSSVTRRSTPPEGDGGMVTLSFRGAFVLDVARPGAHCTTTTYEGAPWISYAGRNTGRPGEPVWSLTAIDDDSDGPHEPSVVLTAGESSEPFTWRRDGGTVRLAADLSRAVLDVELRAVAGSKVVRVKGTIDCP